MFDEKRNIPIFDFEFLSDNFFVTLENRPYFVNSFVYLLVELVVK